MSGIIKGIGKVFKKVVKVVKKVALPALAIGVVVLTGGAALGALPSIGALGSSLGLSSALTGVLSTAATGASIGAGGALLTGGNIVKGATRGFVGGAVMGGIGAAMAPTASTATSAAAGAGGTGAGATVAPLAASGQNVSSLYNAAGIGAGGAGAMPGALARPVLSSLPATVSAMSSTPAAIGQVASSGGSPLSRVFGMIERNPMLTAGLVQGIGSGLSASAQARDARRQQEDERASYDGVGDYLYNYGGGIGGGGQDPNSRFNAPVYGRVAYDRSTGRIVPVGG